MELLKKNIHMSRRKAYGENRMTLSEDFNIPDKKLDAAGLIQKRGEVKLEEVRTTEGQVQLSGKIEYLQYAENQQSGGGLLARLFR